MFRHCTLLISGANAVAILSIETSGFITMAGVSNAGNSVFLRRIQTAPTLAYTICCTTAFSVLCSNRAKEVEVFFADVDPTPGLRKSAWRPCRESACCG